MNLIPWKKKQAVQAAFSESAQKPNFKEFKSELLGEVNYGRVLRLLVTRAIVKHIVDNTELKDDLKINLIPRDGSQSISIDSKLRTSDTLACKIFEQALPFAVQSGAAAEPSENNNKPLLRVGNYRHKSYRSQVEKNRVGLGADPLESYSTKHISLPDLEKRIGEMLAKNGISPESRADLEFLMGEIKERRDARVQMLLASCGHDVQKLAALNTKLADIGATVGRINSLFEQEKNAQTEPPKSLPVKAVSQWPIGDNGAQEIIALAGNCPELCAWISKYALELRTAAGVDILEYTFKESLNNLEHVLERAGAEAKDKVRFERGHGEFMQKMREISLRMDQVDSELMKLNSKLSFSPEDLLSLVSIAQKRGEILSLFEQAYECGGDFCQQDHNRRQIKMIVATMAVNLCKPGIREPWMWREFLQIRVNGHSLEHLLKNEVGACNKRLSAERKASGLKRGKALEDSHVLKAELKARVAILEMMPKSINGFVELATKEGVLLDILRMNADKGQRQFKDAIGQEETELEKLIFGLSDISMPVFRIFLDAYFDSRSHTEYKRGRRLSADPSYYLLPFELALYTHLYSPDETVRLSSLAKLNEYVERNSKIIAVFDKHGLREEILDYADKSTYIKERPFDLESNPLKIKQLGYASTKIDVKYWLGFNQQTGASVINLELGGKTIQVRMPSSLINYGQDEPAAAAKTPAEELYGAKLGLEFITGANSMSDSLDIFYLRLAESVKSTEQSNRVREIFRGKKMDTAHFLYLLAAKRTLSGTVTNIIGELPPEVLNGVIPPVNKDLFEEIKRVYPNFSTESGEAFDYLIWSLRSKALREINRSFPYWINRCADKMGAEASGGKSQL